MPFPAFKMSHALPVTPIRHISIICRENGTEIIFIIMFCSLTLPAFPLLFLFCYRSQNTCEIASINREKLKYVVGVKKRGKMGKRYKK